MDIRNRLYPWPVLSAWSDDYVPNKGVEPRFEMVLSEEIGVRERCYKVDLTLENDELQELIDNGQAEFLVHFECPKTSYRKIVRTKDPYVEQRIQDDCLLDLLSVCAFIVAVKDINGYSNAFFNPDYGMQTFSLHPGSILAVGGQTDAEIEKAPEQLTKVPSIFTICKTPDESEGFMKVSLEGDKIMIELNERNYENCHILMQMPGKVPVFHSMIIVPALIYAFETLRREGIEEYARCRWLKAIKKTLKKYQTELEDEIDKRPSYELAQILLDSPVSRALEAIVDDDDQDDEE